MSSAPPQPARLPALAVVRGVLVWVPLWLYVWLVIDTRLVYFWPTNAFPAYRLGRAFAGEFFGYAGGPTQYIAAFLSQLYYYPWVGALVLTAASAALCGVAWLYLGAVAGRSPALLHYAPVLAVLAVVGSYGHYMGAVLAVLAASFAAWAYVRLCRWGAWPSVLLFVGLSGVVHYVSGGAVLLFALLCALGELGRARFAMAAFCAMWGGALPWVAANCLLPTRLRFAYGRLLPFGDVQERAGRWLAALLYACWPAAGAVAAVRSLAARRRVRRGRQEGAPGLWGRHAVARWVLATAAVLAAGAATAWFSLDRDARAWRRIECCTHTGEWERLLAVAARLPLRCYDVGLSWDVNRALCQTGQLAERMFSYPQASLNLLPNVEAFKGPGAPLSASLEFSDAAMDLGYVNRAEHMAYEALEVVGERPYILQRLALTALAKGETAAGEVLLNALARDVVYGGWARRLLADLEADPTLSGRSDVQRLRVSTLAEDLVTWPDSGELLSRLLERNPQNGAAFEYLMAHLMLTGQLEWLAKEMGRLDELGYATIPRHCEEALLIYQAATGRPVDLGGRSISAASRRRFEAFVRMRVAYAGRGAAGMRALAGEFGDSYFFYNAFQMGG